MRKIEYNGRIYELDDNEFLVDPAAWDRDFAEVMAGQLGMSKLGQEHWPVIDFIRTAFLKTGKCPLVYETCRANGLFLADLKRLFPTGYLRGACKLAGVTYRDSYLKHAWTEAEAETRKSKIEEKVYRVDVRGFLTDPTEWDTNFAIFKAVEMGMEGGLSKEHWDIIYYLRDQYSRNRTVPTIFECCEANNIDLGQLEELFPTGYHRGAIKLAGLRD